MCPISGHISLATYFRILMPLILPGTICKVIYLDVDTLVLDDISKIWACDVSKYPLGAVREPESKTMSNGLGCWREVGVPRDAPYFNAGILLVNLDMWRLCKVVDKLREFLHKYGDRVVWWDQDAMNVIFCNEWMSISENWNVICHADVEMSSKPRGILHFAGSCKPWQYNAHPSVSKIYTEYVDKTAWRGCRPRLPRRRLSRFYVSAYLNRLPVIGVFWRFLRRFVRFLMPRCQSNLR
jgi:lipopolysaccharide biosynthesis glycosyltransferase